MAPMAETANATAVKNTCFRCKKEGHWAKDCPTRQTGNVASQTNASDNGDANHFNLKDPGANRDGEPHTGAPAVDKGNGKSSRRRKRPQVTDMMLMGMDPAVSTESGLQFICKNAKYVIPKLKSHRHSGKELDDLQQLLNFYREWNHTIAPAIPFDEFVRKVEKAGASRRMRVFLSELRRVEVSSQTKKDEEHTSPHEGPHRDSEPAPPPALDGAQDGDNDN